MDGEREMKIKKYADGPARLRQALQKVPAEAMKWRPGPEKWSVHEVVCHCADAEMNAAVRIRFLLVAEKPTIQGYDQAQWAREFDYHDQSLEAALAVVDAVRRSTVPLLRRMSDQDWKREGRHTEMGAYTPESWLNVYSEHLEKHAGQIERNLAQWRAQSR